MTVSQHGSRAVRVGGMRSGLLAVSLLPLLACRAPEPAPAGEDAYTLAGPVHYLTGHPAQPSPGIVHVVVEIPAGTNAKWEVDKADGTLRWEIRDGEPRVVQYLPYPANYGMVPRTLLPAERGGDGDPLDVILMGPAVQRGRVVRGRVLGVLELLDGGERDDKLLAVLDGSPLAGVRSIEELDARFAGVSWIVETWFVNYKGPGVVQSRGFRERSAAQAVLEAAIDAFEESAAGPVAGP